MNRDLATKSLSEWREKLALGSWDVRLSPLEPDEADNRSQVDMDLYQRRAAVRLDSGTPDVQIERQVIHELMHVLMSGMEDAFHQTLDHTPPAVDKHLQRWFDRGAEFAIERLVDVLADATRMEWKGGAHWMAAYPVESQPSTEEKPA